ncbi:MAG: Uma2 family endonuclease, partial [Planctomycetes bacterium]|nr:Uma2 family endonuclease [Planctomycetota bacterium]
PSWEIALCFPRQGDWTENDFLSFESANYPVELVDGCIEVLPMPTPFHQRLVRFLVALLMKATLHRSDGEVLFSPCPIRLWEGQLREPDVFFVKRERFQSDDEPPTGAELVIEVVSPGHTNRHRDLVEKRNDYAKAGILEYWIVDPEESTVHVMSLDGNTYRSLGEFPTGTIANSNLIPEFKVDVTALFDAAKPAT